MNLNGVVLAYALIAPSSCRTCTWGEHAGLLLHRSNLPTSHPLPAPTGLFLRERIQGGGGGEETEPNDAGPDEL